ncbi:MAG: hypothetical protein Q9211_006202, partial [Gyalolechia sp. 1 TL-2023]
NLSPVRHEYKFPELPEYNGHIPIGEPTGSPPGRSRSNAIQHLEPQRQPACSDLPKAGEPTTGMHTLPSRPAESRSPHAVRLPLGSPASHTTQSPTGKTPAGPASLPSREQLTALSEQSRQRLSAAQPPAINIIPPTPPQSPRRIAKPPELLPRVRMADFHSPIHRQPAQSYSRYRPPPASRNGIVNFSLPHAHSWAATKDQEALWAHETTAHQSRMEGRLRPHDTQDSLKGRRSRIGSRARLRKRRRDDVGQAW